MEEYYSVNERAVSTKQNTAQAEPREGVEPLIAMDTTPKPAQSPLAAPGPLAAEPRK